MRIGPYEVREELGRGGSSAVYRARDSRSGEDVAVKVLVQGRDATADQRARFTREARALQGVDHRRVVRLRDVGEHQGVPYLVLDYHPHGSLQDVLDRGGPVDVDVAAQIGLQLAGALEVLHGRGVLHRDLKPDNVLWTSDGDALLTDFGLVKDLERLGTTQALTQTGTFLGTPGYSSPEQAAGTEGDARSDIYGWGATLYAALSGRPPLEGGSLVEVLVATQHQAPASLRRLRPDVPVALAAVVMRCLEKDPDARWASATELREALEAAAAGRPGRAGSQLAAGLGVTAVALAAALVGVSTGRWREAAPDVAAVQDRLEDAAPDVGAVASEAADETSAEPEPLSGAGSQSDDVGKRTQRLAEALARALLEEQHTEALRLADALLELDPRAAVVRNSRATTLWRLGRREEALAEFERAVEVGPREAQVRVVYAKLLEELGDRTGALRQLIAGWRIDPHGVKPREVDALLEGLLSSKRFGEALVLIEQRLRKLPDQGSLRLLRGIVLWRLWRRAEAIVELRVLARRAKPSLAETVRTRLAEFERVRAMTGRRVVRRGEAELLGLVRRAAGLVQRKAWTEARKAVREALAIRRAPVLLRLASQCARQAGRLEAALQTAQEAQRFSGDVNNAAAASWQVAALLLEQGRPGEAGGYLNWALALKDDHALALTQRASLDLGRGYLEESFQGYRRALQAQPNLAEALVGRGWGHFYAGRYRAALLDHERAARRLVGPLSFFALAGRGAALVRLGRHAEAQPVLDHVLAVGPHRFRARFARAELRWAEGKRTAALEDQRAGVAALALTHPERHAALAQLRRMEAAVGGR